MAKSCQMLLLERKRSASWSVLSKVASAFAPPKQRPFTSIPLAKTDALRVRIHSTAALGESRHIAWKTKEVFQSLSCLAALVCSLCGLTKCFKVDASPAGQLSGVELEPTNDGFAALGEVTNGSIVLDGQIIAPASQLRMQRLWQDLRTLNAVTLIACVEKVWIIHDAALVKAFGSEVFDSEEARISAPCLTAEAIHASEYKLIPKPRFVARVAPILWRLVPTVMGTTRIGKGMAISSRHGSMMKMNLDVLRFLHLRLDLVILRKRPQFSQDAIEPGEVSGAMPR